MLVLAKQPAMQRDLWPTIQGLGYEFARATQRGVLMGQWKAIYSVVRCTIELLLEKQRNTQPLKRAHRYA